MDKKLKVALLAHDNKKDELVEFIKENKSSFMMFDIISTKTSGKEIRTRAKLKAQDLNPDPRRAQQEMELLISGKNLDAIFFFRDPVMLYAHELDLNDVICSCDFHRIPIATNIESAKAILSQLKAKAGIEKDSDLGISNEELKLILNFVKQQI